MKFQTIREIGELSNKRVLVRVDFNVPIKKGNVVDDFRIRKSLPTIEYLIKKNAKIILLSHLGRPKGKIIPELRLTAPAKRLSELLNKKIKKLQISTGEEVVREINKMNSADILLLENIQFEPGEIVKDEKLSKELASYGDYFVNECFAQSHRDYASISKIVQYLPSYAGLLLAEEIEGLFRVLLNPKKPLVVVLGGAKMETKIPVLKNLLSKASQVLLGGGLINTYLWANGYKVGKSLIDKNFKKEILEYCKNKKVILPVDFVVGSLDGKEHQVANFDKKFKVADDLGILDIGPRTIQLYSRYIKKSQTIVWNGAMGYFEQHPYEYGTNGVARLVASRSKGKTFGVCGGGETVEVLRKLNLIDDVDLVSTGGGAMLEFLSGKKLPGIEALKK